MAVTITLSDDTFQETWDGHVLASPHGTIFHTWRWLKLVEIQTSTTLLPILIHKGTVLIALYPIFLQKKRFFNIALSGPSKAFLLYLGPIIIDYESSKQDNKENLFIQIQEEVDKYIFNKNKCVYSRIRTSPGILDSRPLRWAGYQIEPLYTYRISLNLGAKSVWDRFEKKLRVNINKATKEGVNVRSGDWGDLEFIYRSLLSRYKAQGIKFSDNSEYLRSLYDCFYPDNLKIFVADYNGEHVGGVITLCYKDIMYHWVGSPKSTLVTISPNDLVQWEAIKWGIENGFKIYEIMDSGDDPRLRQFKAKWNPDLVIWYSATKHSSSLFKIGEMLFNMVRK
jgi:hypothetical protein